MVIEELSKFDRIGVTRLGRHLGLPLPTTYRMLRVLQRNGYVEQLRDSKEYRLTLKVFEIGCQVASRTTMGDVAALEIERLNRPGSDGGSVYWIPTCDGWGRWTQ